MDCRVFLVTGKSSSSQLACPLRVHTVQLARHSRLWQFSAPCQLVRLSHESVPESPTPCDLTVIQSPSLDSSDHPPCVLLTSVPRCLSCSDFSSRVGLKQKWVHPQSMCWSSQVLQVWIKWPNRFGIRWAVTQGHVHSGLSLGRADAASARFAKGPWIWFPVEGWEGKPGECQSLPSKLLCQAPYSTTILS